MSLLGGGKSPFHDDDGSADPRAAATLAAFGSGLGSEHAALTALAAARLLVPIVAAPPDNADHDQPGDPGTEPARAAGGDHGAGPARAAGGDHGAEMSLPTLIGRDGRAAIPAFTSLDTLARWDPRARPVPALAGSVWRAAVDSSSAVVVDVAGPVPLEVEGARLAALAGGQPVPLPHQDPDVLAVVRAAADGEPAIAGLRLAALTDPAADGDPGDNPGDAAAPDAGCDLRVELTLADGCAAAAAQEAARRLGNDLVNQLGGRLRRGITIAVTGSDGHEGS